MGIFDNVMAMITLYLALLLVGCGQASRTRGTDYSGATDWTTGGWTTGGWTNWITEICFWTTSVAAPPIPTSEPGTTTEAETTTGYGYTGTTHWHYWTTTELTTDFW